MKRISCSEKLQTRISRITRFWFFCCYIEMNVINKWDINSIIIDNYFDEIYN